jgi:hypothetical protein
MSLGLLLPNLVINRLEHIVLGLVRPCTGAERFHSCGASHSWQRMWVVVSRATPSVSPCWMFFTHMIAARRLSFERVGDTTPVFAGPPPGGAWRYRRRRERTCCSPPQRAH